MPTKEPKNTMAARANNIVTNPPSYLEYGDKVTYQFLIMDAPTDANISQYIKAMKAKKVQRIVRACEPSYDRKALESEGMKVDEMPFSDGSPPSDDIISRWLQLCQDEAGSKQTVAVHCVAGLGRAPVLVAIALMELCGLECIDAVERIRRVRRGAINQRQLKYLRDYNVRSSKGCTCTIM